MRYFDTAGRAEGENNMLEDLVKIRIENNLQRIILNNCEYLELDNKVKEKLLLCQEKIPIEYHELLEELKNALNICSGKSIELAYIQGMKDLLLLFTELKG